MNLPKYSKGFTLIELLVSMSIIAILAGGIIPSFTGYIKNQNLKQAQEQVKSDLRTVQNRALTGALSDVELPALSGNRVSHWGVLFTSGSGTSMTYIATSSTACPPGLGTFQNQGTSTIPNDIVYFGSGGCMFFNLKNGDISGNVSNPITLKYKSTDTGVNINFNPAGLIWTEN